MGAPFERINFPEVFIALVAPIGVELQSTRARLTQYFESNNYHVVDIRVTDIFPEIEKGVKAEVPLQPNPRFERFDTYIKYGNQIRRHFKSDHILAAITCTRIMNRRLQRPEHKPEGNAYILHQFKRKEEIELLRSVYDRNFFQLSVYSRRGARVDYLARDFAQSVDAASPTLYRDKAEQIVQVDENEVADSHGQRVSAIFHDADIIINADVSENSVGRQIERFCDLLFGSNKISPTKLEYGMFVAKAAALRTLDLSRQVGAAIFSVNGEVLSMGSNEVPKAGGGTYWCDTEGDFDDRDHVRGYDSNDRRKEQLLNEILKLSGLEDKDITDKVSKSQFMDALEYGRIVHAEMSAICDAARTGRSIQDATLFTTAFPCHMCAKHIVAAGLKKVVFLEPYPKSLAAELHGDSLMIEGSDRGKHAEYPCVEFLHFYGISPRRYREIFERNKRKDEKGKFLEWKGNKKQPIIDVKFPAYMELEKPVYDAVKSYLDAIGIDVKKVAAL